MPEHPEHPDIVIEDALDGLWAAIRGRHPDLPAVPIRLLDLPQHRGLFVPPGPQCSAMSIFVDGRWVRHCAMYERHEDGWDNRAVLETLLHEGAHVWLFLRGAEPLKSGHRSYHNPLFRDVAIMMGLRPPDKPNERLGYADCRLPTETAERYADALARYREAMSA